jgi:hypothetical protein
VARFDYL